MEMKCVSKYYIINKLESCKLEPRQAGNNRRRKLEIKDKLET